MDGQTDIETGFTAALLVHDKATTAKYAKD